MSITRHHNDWLRLVPNSGPFLSLPVLAQVFPQGLDAHDAEHARRLRTAFNEWDDNQLGQRPDPGLHRAWLKFVLGETLGHEELLAEGQEIPQSLKSDVAEYGETLRPDWIVNDPATKKARLLVQVYPRSQSLTKPVATSRWKTSPDTRMMQLLHDTGIRLGIVTNGDHWMLVNAPKSETTGYASWYANLWLEEPVTLRAFRTVLGADRLFSVPDDQTLEALLDKSASDQQEVTDQLGYQVRKAVEVLIQALDKADQDHGRKLLADVDEKVLYESALTVMMRLVFLFCAEERELLLLGDELYDKNYAVSTLREQLRVTADQFGEEILGLRYDAWTRLLTTFRAVYAGAKHDRLKLPAYGGSLFNPDRFPFLEGRTIGTTWTGRCGASAETESTRSTFHGSRPPFQEATPLPVSNRTVLHLLEALQVLQTKVGNTTEARNLSFRSLDIEQIGHVYEGLLDHTAKRATEPVLGLAGTRDKEPEIALADLEKIAAKGEKELLKFLKDGTGRSESAIKKGLNVELEDQLASRFRTTCENSDLWKRVKPFAGLVRLDTEKRPVVVLPGSVFVTAGTDRRSSGTHYTPKSLTEPIVQYTLEPLVYVGPAEGLPKEQWKLRPAKELLDLKICDMACGSGAFLVQACRYMAARLLEAWDAVQRANPGTVRITPEGQPSTGKPGEMLIPDDPDERQTYALRIVAQRCLYGVDKNPLAAEMAKLSLWLLTLAKDKPFEFLDHAIRSGDSLVGIHNTEQLRKFNLDGKGEDNRLFLQFLDEKIKEAIALRRQITEMQANTVEDVESQDRMLREANEKIDRLKCAADMLISADFLPGSAFDKQAARDDAAIKVAVNFHDSDLVTFRRVAMKALADQVTFHWPLEFPEVMVERGGFDAFVGNPPFKGGKFLRGVLGDSTTEFIRTTNSHVKGSPDLVAYFLLRAIWLVRMGGSVGLICTKSIFQGETRESSLDFLYSGRQATERKRVENQKWPGTAAVHIAIIWLQRRFPSSSSDYGSAEVGDVARQQPYRLAANENTCFQGTNIVNSGFIVDPQWCDDLIARSPKFSQVLFPLIEGAAMNATPNAGWKRWIIDFHDWPLEKASEFPPCLDVVEKHVKPQRMSSNRERYRRYWWQFGERQQGLYERAKPFTSVIAIAYTSNTLAFTFTASQDVVFYNTSVICTDSFSRFTLLQSSFHIEWIREFGSSLKGDARYAPERCFEPFPFCGDSPQLANTGREFFDARKLRMIEAGEGLTKTYNRFHEPDESSADIQKLRQLQIEMDNAVATAYGWTDFDLNHGFHETKQGGRYTISEAARREVLARLLKLNHERYAEEVEKGLHEKKKSKPAPKPKTKPTSAKVEPSLFDNDGTFPRPGFEDYLCGLVCDLVKADPGQPVSAYVDSLVIALGYERHQRLLTGKDRTTFAKLCKASPLASWSSTDRIPWAELRNLLTRRKAITPEDQTIQTGAKLPEVRNSYPTAAPELVALLRKASAELRELQASANSENTDVPKEITPEMAEILQAFVNDKDQWYGMAA